MIRKLINCKIDSITGAALLVALSSLVSRLLGIFRDRILASEFGAGETLDMYYAAFRIPDLIFNLLVLGALSAGFIPVFIALLKNPVQKLHDKLFGSNHEEAWKLANNILHLLAFTLIILSVVGFLFAPFIMKLIAPGFNPGQREVTAALTRIMFLSPIFLGISSVFGGILQSFKRFFVYSLSPILYNIGIIVGAIYFVPTWGIYGLAWGVVLGAFLHMMVQIPAVFALGYRYKPSFDFRDSRVIKIVKMMVPRTMSLAISQINFLVITIIASTLAAGSLTVFNLANNLQSFPVGIFGISFAIAAFPAMSAMAFDRKKLIKSFSKTIRQILFFVVPSTVLILTLRAQIIRVILGAGHFNWEDTVMTIYTLGYFSISLFAQATIPLLNRVFYARHNSRTPFYIGLVSAGFNVVLSILLAQKMGVMGLALAYSISMIINFILLWLALKVEIGSLDESTILVSTIKFSSASIAAGITVQGVERVILPIVDMTRLWGVLLQGFTAATFGILVYFAFCALFKSEELDYFWCAIKRRMPNKKVDTGDRGEARGI